MITNIVGKEIRTPPCIISLSRFLEFLCVICQQQCPGLIQGCSHFDDQFGIDRIAIGDNNQPVLLTLEYTGKEC